MSDLSWLNPTPHAIAVYASQPLSPVATQHSLPSGRYSLLGPDFHRLDRTSFAWRTHSITSSARASSVGGTSRPSALAVFRLIAELELGRLLDRQVGRLGALQDLVDVVGGAPEQVRIIWSIGHQTARFDEVARVCDRRQQRDVGQGVDANPMSVYERIGSKIKRLRAILAKASTARAMSSARRMSRTTTSRPSVRAAA